MSTWFLQCHLLATYRLSNRRKSFKLNSIIRRRKNCLNETNIRPSARENDYIVAWREWYGMDGWKIVTKRHSICSRCNIYCMLHSRLGCAISVNKTLSCSHGATATTRPTNFFVCRKTLALHATCHHQKPSVLCASSRDERKIIFYSNPIVINGSVSKPSM